MKMKKLFCKLLEKLSCGYIRNESIFSFYSADEIDVVSKIISS